MAENKVPNAPATSIGAEGGETRNSDSANKANMAYYEKLRSDIRETLQKQRLIAKKLVLSPPILPPKPLLLNPTFLDVP